MKFDFELPGGVDVEKGFDEKDALLGRDPNQQAMPHGCHCHGGELTASCLDCKARQRARAKLAGTGVDPEEVYDVIDESGFCTSCESVQPLRGSRPAPPNSDALAEAHRHMTCQDCLDKERSDE